jgi:hypothetical protein
MFNPWLAFSFQAARLGWEVQNAMALRVLGLAGVREQSEHLPENVAPLEAHTAGATGAIKGANGREAAKKVSSVHKKQSRGDKRRPSKVKRKAR